MKRRNRQQKRVKRREGITKKRREKNKTMKGRKRRRLGLLT